MFEVFHNLHFWMFVAFVIMVLLFAKKISITLRALLTSKIEEIEKDIEKSKNLLNEASNLFIEKGIELDKVKSGTDEILHRAQNNADSLFDKTLTKIQNQIKHAKKSLTSYLESQNTNTQFNLNQKLLDNSIENVANIIEIEVDKVEHSRIIDKSIDEIFNNIKKANN